MMNKKGQEGLVAMIVILFFIFLFGAIFAFRIVDYTEYAYEVEFGKLRSDLLTPGFNYIGIGRITSVNNQVRVYNIKVDAPTKDLQSVTFDVNVNAKIKKDESYNFIKDYADEQTYFNYVNNKIQEKSKTIIYKYSANDMVDKRLEIGEEIKSAVKSMSDLKYFELGDIALSNIKYSDQYDAILEQKAKINVEKDIINAQTENLKLQMKNIESIDVDKYFKYQLIEKWDGKTPLIISDSLLTTGVAK